MKELIDPNTEIIEKKFERLLTLRNPKSLIHWPKKLGEKQGEQFITLEKLVNSLRKKKH
jgi:hypothetical protein